MEDLYNGGGSNIFPGLDNETMNALIAAEKNWNKEFKDGSLKQGLPAAGEALATNVDFAAHAPQLATYVLSYVSTSIMSYLAYSTAEMLSIDLGQIPAKAAATMPNFIIAPGVIMKELLTPKESLMDDATKMAELQITENLSKEISDQVSKLTGNINDKLGGVKDTITNISKYASMGPGWMKNKIDVETKKIIESSFKEIASKRDTVKRNINKTINTVGEQMGKKQADAVNQQNKEQAKKELDEINIQKQKAMNKAKNAVINAKLKLMALIGG